ncbi:hypothetical protein ACO0R3_000117 [Hanseniaspora guilliermondii]
MGFFNSKPSAYTSQVKTYVDNTFEFIKVQFTNFITNGITINFLLPLINGVFLGFGEILAKDVYFKYIAAPVVKRRVSKY